MNAITEDGRFTFEVYRHGDQWFGKVLSHVSGAYDITGKPDNKPEWGPFSSEDEAKAWALKHARENLAHGDSELYWA